MSNKRSVPVVVTIDREAIVKDLAFRHGLLVEEIESRIRLSDEVDFLVAAKRAVEALSYRKVLHL